VVASEEEKVFGVLDLVAQEEEDRLEGLLASVDVVPEEEVVGTRREPAHLEQADQVAVLAVDVADNLDRRRKFDQGRLREKDFARGLADGGDFGVLEADGFRHFARVARVEQPRDHVVNVERLLPSARRRRSCSHPG
jgi:hypothetical protein